MTQKFNAKVHATVVQQLKKGAFLTHAAGAARVSRHAVESWIEAGERGEEPYVQFALDVLAAQAEHAEKLQAIILKAATSTHPKRSGDWKAAAWLLARRFPTVWGTREPKPVAPELPAAPAQPAGVHSPWKLPASPQPEVFDA
jgi:hypothetical protein